MLRLRLFARDDLANQIDSRPLEDGEIVIGRDGKADWPVDDPDKAVSRRHLVVGNRGGMVTVRDTSANGVFLGSPRQRIERDRAVPVSRGEAIQFGTYVLLVEEDREDRKPEPARGEPRPFASADTWDPRLPEPSRKPQPFGSALKPDPLADQTPVADEDAWDRQREAPAGSWEATGSHHRPDHATLIGTDQPWKAPPPPERASGFGFDAPFSRPILEEQPVDSGSAVIPSDWMAPKPSPDPAAEAAIVPPADPILPPPPTEPAAAEIMPAPAPAPAPPPISGDDALFRHFCAGAGLRPADLAGEDVAEMMERLGAIYRQTVLGIADLMQERTALRNEYRMVHTTVRPEGNNPFKWVPPQRIALELLRAEGGGYTTGDRALNEALHDLKAHLLCMLAGMRAALTATFDALSPAAAEARVPARNYLIKAQRDAALWAEYMELAERLRAEAEESSEGLINRAFRQAYEAQAAELNGGRQRR